MNSFDLSASCAGFGRRHRRAGAFSLTELLVVLGILAIMTLLAVPGVKSGLFAARKTGSLATLRGYHMALSLYVSENQMLPGPLWGGQSPVYTTDTKFLCSNIWPYFQKEEPLASSIPDWLVTKHFKAWYLKQDSGSSKVPYYMGGVTTLAGGEQVYPFGLFSHDSSSRKDKANWIKFASGADLSNAVVMYEALATESAPTRAPKEGEIQNYQAYLYFDGHVEARQ